MKKTFTLLAAMLSIALLFGQTQRTVLFEEFVGENCPPCAAIAPDVDAVLNGNNSSEVVYMQYLTYIPLPGTLYYEDEADPDARLTYYSFNSTPSGRQDGVQWNTGEPQQDWYNPDDWALDASYLNTEYQVTSPFNLSVAHTLTETTDSFYATVNINAAQNFTSTGALVLQVVMVEDLQFEYAPGNNGVTFFPHALRKMYPGSGGTGLSATWTNGQSKTLNFAGKVPSYIRDKSKISFIAFIQETGNKYVEQAAISNPYTFNNDLQAAGIQGIFGNCYSASYTPVFNINNIGNQQVTGFYVQEYLDGVFLDSVACTNNLPASNSLTLTLPAIPVSAGVHTLSLAVTSPSGLPDANPANDTAAITFNMPSPPAEMPLTEGFENGTDGWSVESPDHDSTWRIVNTGDASSYSYMLDCFDIAFNGEFVNPINNLYSPLLNLTYAAHATVSFAYANQAVYFDFPNQNEVGLTTDSLYIDVSSDCGTTWKTVYGNGGLSLRTTTTYSTYSATSYPVPFTPTSTEWAVDSADISIVANNPEVYLRFRGLAFDGNNIYIDNVNIYKYDSTSYTPPPTAITETSGNIQSINVYPNPSNTQINVNLELNTGTEVDCILTDITGNMVATLPQELKTPGENTFSISTASLSDGMYILTVSSGSDRISKRIAVMH